MSQGPDTITNLNIQFPVRFSIITAIIVIVLSSTFALATSSFKETLIFFAALSAAGAQTCATFYTAKLLSETITQNKLAAAREEVALRRAEQIESAERARADHAKVVHTLQFGTRYNDPQMYHIRDTLREIVMHNGTNEELLALIDKKNTNVIHILNFFEEMGTSHRLDLCGNDILKAQFDVVVVGIWRKLSPWILKHRQDRGCNGLWEDTERIYDLWKIGL